MRINISRNGFGHMSMIIAALTMTKDPSDKREAVERPGGLRSSIG